MYIIIICDPETGIDFCILNMKELVELCFESELPTIGSNNLELVFYEQFI